MCQDALAGLKGRLLYGGDYNSEQWLDRPDILSEDIRLLKMIGCNAVSLGMFSWSALEPKEGSYEFGWLSDAIESLYSNGISVILATPSAARPPWLARAYPEVLRVDANRQKNLFGGRENHCLTSPIYRQKTAAIDKALAERFGSHPGVIMWHISNEFSGDCHCELCNEAFRQWLKERYGTVDRLNAAWQTGFWSHVYSAFDEIDSPSPIGESGLHGLTLAWKRFVTDQTVDFMRAEANSVRSAGSAKPVTTNFMYRYDGLDYGKFRDFIDIVSWDNYPLWGKGRLDSVALDSAFNHDVMRSIKREPFMLIESAPSVTSWQGVSRRLRPGMLEAASFQAISHGSDSVMFFQVRQSRGGSEKFHGALIDHYGGDDTRVLKEAGSLGKALAALDEISGTGVKADVAIIYDKQNKWALEDAQGPRNAGLRYAEHAMKHYGALCRLGQNIDVIESEQSYDRYKVIVAPMLYMLRGDTGERLRRFVERGGILVTGYLTGIVDEDDQCRLNGTPGGGLMDVAGLRSSELDALYDDETNAIVPTDVGQIEFGLNESGYGCGLICDVVELRGAQALAGYGRDYYQNTPAFTRNSFGKGVCYYVCSDAEQAFFDDVYSNIARAAGIWSDKPLAKGLMMTARQNERAKYYFFQNFAQTAVSLPAFTRELDIVWRSNSEDKNDLSPHCTAIFKSRYKEYAPRG